MLIKDPNDIKKVKFMSGSDLVGEHKKQYEFLNDPRLDDVTIAVVPKELWIKGSQPSESHAEKGLILVNEDYFNGEDEIAWLVHELAHCAAFIDYPDDYERMSAGSYPDNQVEAFTFKKQFEYLKQIGVKREDVVAMLKKDYKTEEDFQFFNRILDEVG